MKNTSKTSERERERERVVPEENCKHKFVKYPPKIGKLKICTKCGFLWVLGDVKFGEHTVKLSGSGNYIEVNTTTAPASPASGKVRFYATSNVYLKMQNSSGTEIVVSTGVTQSVTASGATTTIDFSSGDTVTLTLNASTTLTLSNPITGLYYLLKCIQDATGSRTITWPASVKWSGGTAPTLTTTASKTDLITLWWDGTNYFGTSSLNY